jgi:hypothetical protein
MAGAGCCGSGGGGAWPAGGAAAAAIATAEASEPSWCVSSVAATECGDESPDWAMAAAAGEASAARVGWGDLQIGKRRRRGGGGEEGGVIGRWRM